VPGTCLPSFLEAWGNIYCMASVTWIWYAYALRWRVDIMMACFLSRWYNMAHWHGGVCRFVIVISSLWQYQHSSVEPLGLRRSLLLILDSALVPDARHPIPITKSVVPSSPNHPSCCGVLLAWDTERLCRSCIFSGHLFRRLIYSRDCFSGTGRFSVRCSTSSD